ncbi:MAG TPA: Vms1/Ankzf1 family peptidyl-tRNA hydrolase [Thermodesulfobacteriota bacterium]|nr:Vms1/Ankzf1 family peptidyl-tRNA hydrolase [Thermodesulfobacteriota bacterium]
MNMRSEIKKLARIEEGPCPFCSLYLNTRWDDEQQRERIRLFTKNQMKKAFDRLRDQEDWQRAFPEDQRQIERCVEGLVRRTSMEGVNGFAIFSCSGTGTFLTYPSIIPYENEFSLSSLPVLRPLVKLSTQYQNTLAVMVETDSAKLLEVSLEGLMGESSIESYVPGRHDQGGWAQMRYQRHIQDHRDRHHKEVAQHLTDLFDSGKWKQVILMGQERILANFKTFLPERVKQQMTDTFPVDFSEERSKILRRLFERLLQKEKESLSRQIKELRERAPQNGLASFGLSATLDVLNQGQVHTLYLLSAPSLNGRQCRRCNSLFLIPPSGDSSAPCPLCKGERKTVDLAEEMMRSTLRQDGEVKWIDDHPILKENEGVAASLRFR